MNRLREFKPYSLFLIHFYEHNNQNLDFLHILIRRQRRGNGFFIPPVKILRACVFGRNDEWMKCMLEGKRWNHLSGSSTEAEFFHLQRNQIPTQAIQ